MITFEAIDRRDGQLKKYRDLDIEAVGFFDARWQLDRQGKTHCHVEGIVLIEANGDRTESQKLYN
jgi:hypothetical protein